LRSLILPAIALSAISAAEVTRQLRGSLADVLQSEYIMAARARGVTPNLLVLRDGLRNSLVSVVAVLGVRVAQLIGGTVVIETLFNIHGLGSTVVSAAIQGDVPVVLGVTIVIAVVVILTSIVIDAIQPALNPRLRTS
jgi:peptide/nickel transport system permease protein